MTPTLQPLNIGGILDRAVQILRGNFPLFAGLALFPGVAQLAMQLTSVHPATITDPSGGHILLVLASYVASLFFTVANLVLQAVAMAAMSLAASKVMFGEPTSIRTAFNAFSSKKGRLVGLELLQGLYSGWPMILVCIFAVVVAVFASSPYIMVTILVLGSIPCIILYTRYALAFPACAIENLTAGSAIDRSVKLSEGGRWRIFGGILFPGIAAGGFSGGSILLIESMRTHIGWLASHPMAVAGVNGAISLFADVIFIPVSALVLTVLYYDQRIRREGYDIEKMMEGAGLSAPRSSPSGDIPIAPVVEESNS